LDIDDDVATFLAELPDLETPKRRQETVDDDDLFEDPVQTALENARGQSERIEEGRRVLSTAELAREWGFEDPQIAKNIRRIMKQMNG
jgi:hypothetical protein